MFNTEKPIISRLPLLGLVAGLVAMLSAAAATAQNEDDLLPPEEAFAFSSEWADNALIARWQIADGYYMYQDKIAVESLTDGVEIGELILLPGKPKIDEFFGEVAIYTDHAEVKIPLTAQPPITGVALAVWGQGCNEPVGVCYPPIKNVVSNPLALIGTAEAQGVSTEKPLPSNGSLNSLADLLSDLPSVTADNLLAVDQAFQLDVFPISEQVLSVSFRVTEGYYLYQDKLHFEAAGAARMQEPIYPPGQAYSDAYFGDVVIYPADFEIELPMIRATPEASLVELTATYQGCAKDLICYPPVVKSFKVALPSLVDSAYAATDTALMESANERSGYQELGFWWLVISAFGTGLLLTFTPCVLPLIPILSSIVVGQNRYSRMRGGVLSIIYVSGTVVAYAFIGAVAGATGDQLSAYFQNAWAIGIMSAVFVLMSLSLFGIYEIRLPVAFESRIQEHSMKIGGGRVGAVFTLGVLSALVVSACVSPLLISALSIAIARADPYLGAAMMTSMALGMGAILIGIGFGASIALPKAGPWMDRLKQFFGVLLLSVAIYLLGNLPEVPVLLLWGALFIVTGVFLGASQELPADAGGWRYFWKGVGLVLLIWGILNLIGGLIGNRDVLQPLAALHPPMAMMV